MIEAVPNVSEGRRPETGDALARAAGAELLDLSMDPDHHRCVITLAGAADPLAETAFRLAQQAVERIDLNRHRGEHPRMGALDVLPFVPLGGSTLEDCIALARRVGRRLGGELGLPVFLYEAAATRPERRNLADLRRPRFEGLRDLIGRDPAWRPDFGPERIHPTAGCVAVGARGPLVAFNLDLETDDLTAARAIARRLRRLPGIKALGIRAAARACAQVSVNVCDFTRTGLLEVFRAVEAEAPVRSSEIVGFVPRAALPPDPARSLKLSHFAVLEDRLP